MARTEKLKARGPTRALRLLVAVGLAGWLAAAGCTLPRTSGPVSAWIVSDSREVGPGTEPLLENEVYSASRARVELTAAIGETVAFQLVLRTDRPPAGPIDVELGELTGPTKPGSARPTAALFRAHYVRVEQFRSWYPQRTGRSAVARSFPDVLVPWDAPHGGGPVRLEQTHNYVVWVDLHVPPTTAPGSYEGRLRVRDVGRDTPVLACVLRVRVVPIAIPSARSLPLLCRVDPRDLLSDQLGWPRLEAAQTRILPDVPTHLAARRLLDATMLLFHEHRATPLLWASFPKYELSDPHTVAIDWEPYDRLVAGWLDGSAFPDRVGLARWALPVCEQYPSAERNGGPGSARYARVLAAYLRECRRHFAERGWLERAFVRLTPPVETPREALERVRHTAGIVRESGTNLPLVAHLPPRSLRSLGWHDAAPIELPGVAIWSPPARWCEPELLKRQRDLGRETWFIPDWPPYSPALAVESPAVDARVLAWQAFRYGLEGVWLEHAAEFERDPGSGTLRPAPGLVYPGRDYGLIDVPVPSLRLKRLRRGLLDYELLRLLEHHRQPLLARRTCEQIVRRALTEACAENLLATHETGWADSPYVFWLARRVLLQELINQLAPSAGGREAQLSNLADWGALMHQARRVRPQVSGARLAVEGTELRARLFVRVLNDTDQPLRGRWELPAPPIGWEPLAPQTLRVAPHAWAVTSVEARLAGLTYNADGVYPFELVLDTQAGGAFRASGRLAAAVCPLVDEPPTIDGELSDWMLAAGNTAADFLLVRGDGQPRGTTADRRPFLPTRAFFCMDRERLYCAIRCVLGPRDKPRWRADNLVPIDGAIPWGQDVVEILLDPHGIHQGTAAGIYCLQVKPSGLLVAHRGCPTDPPLCPSRPWPSEARVAVSVGPEAWVVELSVPFSAFGPAAERNRVWGCNITRLDAARGEYSSWSGAQGYAYAPHLLGNLVLLRP